jgi:hypothetical protein
VLQCDAEGLLQLTQLLHMTKLTFDLNDTTKVVEAEVSHVLQALCWPALHVQCAHCCMSLHETKSIGSTCRLPVAAVLVAQAGCQALERMLMLVGQGWGVEFCCSSWGAVSVSW